MQIDLFKVHIFRQTFKKTNLDTFKQIDSDKYLEGNMHIGNFIQGIEIFQ
jgi:hypothetical protein